MRPETLERLRALEQTWWPEIIGAAIGVLLAVCSVWLLVRAL